MKILNLKAVKTRWWQETNNIVVKPILFSAVNSIIGCNTKSI